MILACLGFNSERVNPLLSTSVGRTVHATLLYMLPVTRHATQLQADKATFQLRTHDEVEYSGSLNKDTRLPTPSMQKHMKSNIRTRKNVCYAGI